MINIMSHNSIICQKYSDEKVLAQGYVVQDLLSISLPQQQKNPVQGSSPVCRYTEYNKKKESKS